MFNPKELFNKNRMNASDIVKLKQNGTLYKAYYNPSIYSSFVYSTLYPVISTIGGVPSTIIYSSCSTTINTYLSNPFTSYQLAADVNNGKYVCGGKKISYMTWQSNPSMSIQPTYAFSSFISSNSSISSTSSIYYVSSVILSNNSYSVKPLICTDSYTQGTNFANTCNVCNNMGSGANATCYNCVSG